MINIKWSFDKVVKENMSFVFNYVKSKLKNKDLVEDIVQEVFIRAYKAYDHYQEKGKLKSWLIRIAKNTLNNYFISNEKTAFVSLDSDYDNTENLYNYISDHTSPEEVIIRNELISDILKVVNKLPDVQKQVFTLRYLGQYTVSETAFITGIPVGSVKSNSHYAIKKIRSLLGIQQNNNKRSYNMENIQCNDAYKYLFMYAKSTISDEKRALIKQHIDNCCSCKDIVTSLEKLLPNISFAKDDETTHFLINFPETGISYCGCSVNFSNTQELNKYLKENKGKVNDTQEWVGGGFSKCYDLIGMFDNEGNEFGYKIFENGDNYRIKTTYIKKLYPLTWVYYTYLSESNSPITIKKSKEAPNLYYGSMHNCMGNNAKSALYQAIQAKAENVRIKRGNGIIDCGSYKFAYVDRYVTEEERISLDYSFLLN